MSTEAKGLYPKLAEAIAEVERIGKDGFNDHHKYKFTSAEQIYRVIRKPLLERGLIIVPSIPTSIREGTLTTASLHLKIVDTETGESLEADWVGEGADKQDKAIYKAATGGMKTWLKHLFMLPADDDPGADHTTDEPTTLEVLASEADRARVPKDVRQTIGAWIHPDGQLDEGLARQAIAGIRAGEVQRLLDTINADAAKTEAVA